MFETETERENMNTNQVNQIVGQTNHYLDQLASAPSLLLVLLSCLIIGWVLKALPKFPNAAIPMVVVLAGVILVMLVQPERPATLSVRVFRTRGAMIGLIIGFASWALHYYVLYRLESLPWFAGVFKSQSASSFSPLGTNPKFSTGGGIYVPPAAQPPASPKPPQRTSLT